jgi:hypothetical protein
MALKYDTSLWPVMPHQQQQRLIYTIDYLEHASSEQAAAASGMRSHHAHKRTIEHLKKYGTFAEAAHERPRTKFTPDVMQQAVDILTELNSGYMNTQELLRVMHDDHILAAPTNPAHFRQALQEYLNERNMCLLVGRTAIFRITDKNAQERLAFVERYIPQLPKWGLDNVVIVDETTVEESPHPKGKHAHHQQTSQPATLTLNHTATPLLIGTV